MTFDNIQLCQFEQNIHKKTNGTIHALLVDGRQGGEWRSKKFMEWGKRPSSSSQYPTMGNPEYCKYSSWLSFQNHNVQYEYPKKKKKRLTVQKNQRPWSRFFNPDIICV